MRSTAAACDQNSSRDKAVVSYGPQRRTEHFIGKADEDAGILNSACSLCNPFLLRLSISFCGAWEYNENARGGVGLRGLPWRTAVGVHADRGPRQHGRGVGSPVPTVQDSPLWHCTPVLPAPASSGAAEVHWHGPPRLLMWLPTSPAV